MALLNTAATSAATVATPNARSASPIACGAPGAASHSAAQPARRTRPEAAIHGFFGPVASAMLPSAGESTASANPAIAVA